MLNYKFKKIVQQKILNYEIYKSKRNIYEKSWLFIPKFKLKTTKF